MSRFAGRGLDQVWFIFFVSHFIISLCVDLQPLYPAGFLDKTPLPAFLSWYLSFSRDPIVSGAAYGGPKWDWLRCFFWLEALFQMPCFAIAALGLWKNDRRVYPLIVAYGASTATTLIPVLQALISNTHTMPPLNMAEMSLLLSSYVPFLAIPLLMSLDMSYRITRIINTVDARKHI